MVTERENKLCFNARDLGNDPCFGCLVLLENVSQSKCGLTDGGENLMGNTDRSSQLEGVEDDTQFLIPAQWHTIPEVKERTMSLFPLPKLLNF